MDLTQKVRQTDHQGCGRSREERAHKPLQIDLGENFQEERRDYHANQKGGERAGRDCGARKMTPAFEALKLDLKCLARLKLLRDWVLSEMTASVNDASQAARHDVEDGANPGEQEDRRQRELNGVSHVSDID